MKIPVILDTDIGTDIDDTWALGLILKCPELDVKLISCVSGDTQYRAKIVAKFLERANRTDIPIAYNNTPPKRKAPKMQSKWVKDYNLNSFPGQIYTNAPQAICEVVSNINSPSIIISIGPLSNIAEAIKLDPKICSKSRFVGMQGSIYKGYFGSSKAHREYNVMIDIESSRTVFQADWTKLITPLDTCWFAILKDSLYQQLRESQDPIVKAIMENYRLWAKKFVLANYHKKSTNLFDTVAIYLAIAEDFVEIEELPILIDEKGFTRVNPQGTNVRCALRWKSLEEFKLWLVNRLLD